MNLIAFLLFLNPFVQAGEVKPVPRVATPPAVFDPSPAEKAREAGKEKLRVAVKAAYQEFHKEDPTEEEISYWLEKAFSPEDTRELIRYEHKYVKKHTSEQPIRRSVMVAATHGESEPATFVYQIRNKSAEEKKREDEMRALIIDRYKSYLHREPAEREIAYWISQGHLPKRTEHFIRYSDEAKEKLFDARMSLIKPRPDFMDLPSEKAKKLEKFKKLGLCREDIFDKLTPEALLHKINTAREHPEDEATCEDLTLFVAKVSTHDHPYDPKCRICGDFARAFHWQCKLAKKSCLTVGVQGKKLGHLMNAIKLQGCGWRLVEPQNGNVSSCVNDPKEFTLRHVAETGTNKDEYVKIDRLVPEPLKKGE